MCALVVTFLGHRDSPALVRAPLKEALSQLIESEGADTFYIGNSGCFDRVALAVLQELKKAYPHIRYFLVLAYLPQKPTELPTVCETIFPAEVAAAPVRFAIERRNDWMLQQSDTVITYVTRPFGGAAKFKKKALAAQKRVIELSEPAH